MHPALFRASALEWASLRQARGSLGLIPEPETFCRRLRLRRKLSWQQAPPSLTRQAPRALPATINLLHTCRQYQVLCSQTPLPGQTLPRRLHIRVLHRQIALRSPAQSVRCWAAHHLIWRHPMPVSPGIMPALAASIALGPPVITVLMMFQPRTSTRLAHLLQQQLLSRLEMPRQQLAARAQQHRVSGAIILTRSQHRRELPLCRKLQAAVMLGGMRLSRVLIRQYRYMVQSLWRQLSTPASRTAW